MTKNICDKCVSIESAVDEISKLKQLLYRVANESWVSGAYESQGHISIIISKDLWKEIEGHIK